MSRTIRPAPTERRRMWAATRRSEKHDKALEHRRWRAGARTALASGRWERAEQDKFDRANWRKSY